MEITKKVFVFVDETCLVAQPGQFDQWCAFAETELEAEAKIHLRYRLGGRRLKCIQTIEDRRKPRDRRAEERRIDG